MGPYETKARKNCETVLKRIEAHLLEHPCGESYFGMAAAKNPGAVARLRQNKIVGPATLDKLLAHIEAREGVLSGGGDQ